MASTLIQAHHLSLNYGTAEILKDLSLEINMEDKIGLIGVNGAGKSSLLRVLTGQIERDFGAIYTSGNISVAYLSQDPMDDIQEWKKNPILKWFVKKNDIGVGEMAHNLTGPLNDFNEKGMQLSKMLMFEGGKTDSNREIKTVQDLISWQISINLIQFESLGMDQKELLGRENEIKTELKKLMGRFGNLDLELDLNVLSGGQLRRLGLFLILAFGPNLMLIDEPTNHLDLEAIEELEKYLAATKTPFIFVSHDRYFVDKVAETMWELSKGALKTVKGGYSDFLKSKSENREKSKTESWKQKQYLKRELQWVRAGVQARGTKDKGRMDRYTVEKDDHDKNKFTQNDLNMILPPCPRLGSRIIDIKESCVGIAAQEKVLWTKFTHNIQRREKIGLIGPNGCGKSTLLKFLMGTENNLNFDKTGTIKIGSNTEFLYFDQHKTGLEPDQTPLLFIGEGREIIDFGGAGKTIPTRRYLSNWLFSKNQYSTAIKNMSGGEKSRLLLAKAFLKGGNLLILDEPTNDLDLETLMVLEQALNDFQGSIILISHDRTFINRTCNHIWFFDDGKIFDIAGDYDNFLKWKGGGKAELIQDSVETVTEETADKNHFENKKLKAQITRLEGSISNLEAVILDLGVRMQNPTVFKDKTRFEKLRGHMEREELKLGELLKSWEELIEKFEIK